MEEQGQNGDFTNCPKDVDGVVHEDACALARGDANAPTRCRALEKYDKKS